MFAFVHGFLRWRVVNKYSLLFSCIRHEDVPDGICSTKRQVASGALNTLALINQQVFGKEAGVFLLTPNLALRAIYPWCGRSQFAACYCSVRMDATTPRCQSACWNIFPRLISIFHFGLVAWAGSGKDAVCCPEWGNLLPNSFKHCAEVTGMLAGEARFPAPLVSTWASCLVKWQHLSSLTSLCLEHVFEGLVWSDSWGQVFQEETLGLRGACNAGLGGLVRRPLWTGGFQPDTAAA